MNTILKFDLQKESNYIFQKKIMLTTQKKTQFCMWQLHFP